MGSIYSSRKEGKSVKKFFALLLCCGLLGGMSIGLAGCTTSTTPKNKVTEKVTEKVSEKVTEKVNEKVDKATDKDATKEKAK